MDSIDLNSVPINPPSIEKLDTVKTKSETPQNSTGSKSTDQQPLMGGCLGKGQHHFVDPGANVEEKNQDQSLDFQKARDAHLKQQRLTRSHDLQKKTTSTVKNSIRLGYILYEATIASRVTFSYELTGRILPHGPCLTLTNVEIIFSRSKLYKEHVHEFDAMFFGWLVETGNALEPAPLCRAWC